MAMELVRQLPYDHPYRWDGTLFGGSKLWRPDELETSLELWLDAEDTSTITLNGSNVTQWNDKSGNNRHATQATASNQPLLSTINNRQALSFDGADDVMESVSSFQLGAQFSVFSVVKPEFEVGWSANNYKYLFSHGLTPTAGAAFTLGSQTYNDWVTRDLAAFGDGHDSGRAPRAIGPVSQGTDARIVNITLGDSSSYVEVNTTTTSTRVSTVGTRVDISDVLKLGANKSNSQNLQGKIAEFIIISADVTLDTKQRMEGYLAWKWELEADLPSGHPYKSTPPTV